MGDNWIYSGDALPVEEGLYLVYAKSENPDKPFYSVAFWDGRFWLGIPDVWASTVTHWQKLEPPKNER